MIEHGCEIYTYDEAYNTSLDYFGGDELAAKVFVDKYALRDADGNFIEDSPKKTHLRLAKEFARIEKNKFKNPLTEEEIFNYFDRFRYIIPQGSPMYGIGNNYQYVSLSNCFVLTSPEDSYGAILATDEELVQVSKRRGGVGIDLSKLRPVESGTNNAARTSTGVSAFMQRYSNSINEVGQSGRRGALMLTISVHHPDILEFVRIKNDLTKVTGANISVKLSNEFLEAVQNSGDYELRFPVDARERNKEVKISKMVSAKEIWNEIVKNAHASAEPGILFWNNIIENSPADSYKHLGFETVSTNPCVVGDTLVLTNLGWMQIKNLENYKIKYKDLKIITRDSKGEIFSSELEWVGVTHKDAKLNKIEFNNLEMLLTTPEHKLYLEDFSEIEVKNLKIGDNIIGGTGLLKIENIENIENKEDVYDLTANPNYNFYSILNRPEAFEDDFIEINDEIKFRYYDIVELETGDKIFAKDLQVSHEIKDIS